MYRQSVDLLNFQKPDKQPLCHVFYGMNLKIEIFENYWQNVSQNERQFCFLDSYHFRGLQMLNNSEKLIFQPNETFHMDKIEVELSQKFLSGLLKSFSLSLLQRFALRPMLRSHLTKHRCKLRDVCVNANFYTLFNVILN